MIKNISNIRLKDVGLYGGKGASLGELVKMGINVPNAFVIPVNLLDLNKFKKEIFSAFKKLCSQYAAVRSSANVEDSSLYSFAGQFETYLFVDKENLLDKIFLSRKFLSSDKIQAYCKTRNISRERIKLAVVVQKMIRSDYAGICFTMNPVTQNSNEIIIEACYGIGEALVSGKITPDYYSIKHGKIKKKVNKQAFKLVYDPKKQTTQYIKVPKELQNTQKLKDNHIKKIVEIAKKIENHYGKPMDIEWAIEGDRIYILQARPITTSVPEKKDQAFNIDSDKYNHLWDWGAPYIIATLDLETFSEDGVWDFISYSSDNKVSLYISKDTQKKISEKNFLIYYENYDQYETHVKLAMNEVEKYLRQLGNHNFSLFSNIKLADEFEKYFQYAYEMNRHYAATECFSTEKVEKVLVDQDKKYDLEKLQRNVKRMGDFKLEQRNLLNKLWNYKKGILAKFFNEIQERLKLDGRPVDYHYKELLELLRGKKINLPNRSIWMRGKFSSWKNVLGKTAKDLYKSLSYIDRNLKIIHGVVSCKGKYIGKVRKIPFDIKTNYDKEISKMAKGEVLVTGSTGPEMILACHKAGAIVTEEGGVISHAAIISRELGIPCVTGTHIACKVLQNGDLIEVDAFNGIVKILEKNEKPDR